MPRGRWNATSSRSMATAWSSCRSLWTVSRPRWPLRANRAAAEHHGGNPIVLRGEEESSDTGGVEAKWVTSLAERHCSMSVATSAVHPSGGWRRALARCRRRSIRRTVCGPSSAGPRRAARSCRGTADADRDLQKKRSQPLGQFVGYPSSVTRLPLPVGHSTVNESPKNRLILPQGLDQQEVDGIHTGPRQFEFPPKSPVSMSAGT